MPRSRPLAPAILLAAALLATTAVTVFARPFRTPPAAAPWAVALGEADSLLRAQRVDDGLKRSAQVRADALAHGQLWTVMATHVIDAAGNGMIGRPVEAEASARNALALSGELRDAGYRRRAQRWLAFALSQEGRAASSDSLWRVLLRESVAAKDTAHVGYAELGIAYGALVRGNVARAVPHYRAAVRWLVLARDGFLAATARIGLARSLTQLGDVDGARAIYIRLLAEAERTSRGRAAADALNNLGALERQAGDGEEAAEYWRRSIAAFRAVGDPGTATIPAGNLALALAENGSPDAALAVVDSTLASVRRLKRPDLESALWLKRAEALEPLGRFDEAWTACERARALLGTNPEKPLMDVRLEQYSLISQRGTPRERLEFAEREFPPLLPFATGLAHFQLQSRLADAYLVSGRWREAYAAAVRAESLAATYQLPAYSPAAWLTAGRAQRGLGDRAGAMLSLRRARMAWDSLRVAARDPEWREREGQRGGIIAVELADVMLEGHEHEPARLAATWEMLQSCKSRTLLERMRGPLAFASGASRARPVVSLARLRAVMRPGEVLLDAFAGDRFTLLFAVSPRGIAVTRLPGADSLAARLRLYPRLLARSGGEGSAAMLARATDAVSDLVLAPFAAELAAASRVVLSPDGALQQLPFAELTLPSAHHRVALGAGRELCRVPSATVFAELRARVPAAGAPRTLAWFGGAAPGRPALPGAATEVAWMKERLSGVTTQDGADVRALPGERAFASYDVLHFATHARLLPHQPWGSALLLADSARCADPWLRAERVARMRLRARLAVLSGCETGGGEVLTGEGVLGMTNAFLAAGASTVVASLWRVDDRATASFMRLFYAALGRGATVSGALGEAQRAMAAEPATAAPFYWAGFVVSGDGAVRVPLRLHGQSVFSGL
jgi:tetratricopeptide (TPR) repeat protein